MKNISEIDKNFVVKSNIEKDNIKFFNADESPFKVYGVYRDGDRYRRLPESVAQTVNPGVLALHANTAGGRVRFVTDSRYVAINTIMDKIGKMPHFPFSGSAGFDLYADNVFIKSFMPPVDIHDGYESLIEFDSKQMRDITINFPLYSDVKELYIGLEDSATVEASPEYKSTKPIVYYGSSITQGGCASRPGTSYQSFVSRAFDYDYINLGFSGNAKAEDEIVEYISNLDMSVFVYDYDHNAPTTEHLKNTHEKMFKAIRQKHPDMPVVMMSRPKHILTEEEQERLNIIKTTYNNALSAGDKNVYLITGSELTALCKNEGTVDNCHPTDFGFGSMAKALETVLEKIAVI